MRLSIMKRARSSSVKKAGSTRNKFEKSVDEKSSNKSSKWCFSCKRTQVPKIWKSISTTDATVSQMDTINYFLGTAMLLTKSTNLAVTYKHATDVLELIMDRESASTPRATSSQEWSTQSPARKTLSAKIKRKIVELLSASVIVSLLSSWRRQKSHGIQTIKAISMVFSTVLLSVMSRNDQQRSITTLKQNVAVTILSVLHLLRMDQMVSETAVAQRLTTRAFSSVALAMFFSPLAHVSFKV